MAPRGNLFDIASRAVPGRGKHQYRQSDDYTDNGGNRSPSLSSSDNHALSSSHHGNMQEVRYTDDLLVPPNLPFSEVTSGQYSNDGSQSRQSSYSDLTQLRLARKDDRPPSLSVNYVPTKFTKPHSQGEWAHRRAKIGGGRDAFAANAQRMGAQGTVDDDEGLVFELGKGGLKAKHKPKLRWNRFKWILFLANSVLIIYAMAGLVSCILVWINVFYQSDVIRVGNRTELILSTFGAALMTFTALLGYSGLLLNFRPFLAVYTVLLWVSLAFIVAPGYITYKKKTFNLEGKINLQWSRQLGTMGRLRIQDALKCCGYFSPSVEAVASPLCYPRSIEDGCKNRYIKLERSVLKKWYTISFSLVGPHILIILAGLLCSNHVTYRFGKGLTPKRYRLDLDSMAVIMNDYASQIAAQYGPDVAAEAVSRSSIHLESRPGSRAGSRAGSRRGSIIGGSSLGHGSTVNQNSRLAASTSPTYSNPYASPFDDPNGNQTRYTDADDDGNSTHSASNYGSQHNHTSSNNNNYYTDNQQTARGWGN